MCRSRRRILPAEVEGTESFHGGQERKWEVEESHGGKAEDVLKKKLGPFLFVSVASALCGTRPDHHVHDEEPRDQP
ncbi:hypothetical protein FF1_006821 [Malus domestica]